MHEAASVLIVMEDVAQSAALTERMTAGAAADVTLASNLQEAKTLIDAAHFDAILVASSLPDGDGLSLLRDDPEQDTPVIVLDETLDAARVLDALRLGAVDVLPQPTDMARLVEVVRSTLDDGRQRRRQESRMQRMRRMSNRMMKDRRELRLRIDLICKDIVHAYRRLAEKIVDHAGPSLSGGRADDN